MLTLVAPLLLPLFVAAAHALDNGPEWISLFNGNDLDGWKPNENPETFRVKDGAIVAHGKRSHLFYVGPVSGADFKNFELQTDVRAEPNSNGGIYFHTEFQPEGWPEKGFEVQVNNTYNDKRRTGSLYGVEDVFEAPAKDGEWFHQHLTVDGSRVTIQIDDKTVAEWTQPDGFQGLNERKEGQPRAALFPAPQARQWNLRPAGPRCRKRGLLQEHPGEAAALGRSLVRCCAGLGRRPECAS